MRNFEKNLIPKETENKWYKLWLENGIFKADENSTKPKFSMLMPPPNVTGILHFGHVLNHTIPDIYIRKKRMEGYEVCWFPGIDHAGIATQTRVEKELKTTENLTRYDLGRDKFVDKVWEWKEKYGGIIFDQMRRLGISCDWDRTLFTMDETAYDAVIDVFVKLFDQGLIYKGKRIINWSPVSRTALSDEEVEFREVRENLYTLRYKIVGLDLYLKVATVRPETIYGDVAVAVNPNDVRYKHLIGKNVIVPLVNRSVPIVADDYADPEFGTGCVKITPAHDPNDFELGKRHNLPQINTINPDGTLNELTGEFNGMERFEARKAFVKKLQELDLIEKIEDYTHNVGFSQRGGEPIEPYLSEQWFVKMQPLAEIALKEASDSKVKFYPNHWIKTYEHWLNNVKDWCISRQLWWGHRIPVYYSQDGKFTAALNEAEARQKLGLDSNAILKQDEDVLDTWFSSWLWPLTTMRWDFNSNPDDNQVIKSFLPTDLIVTGPDIIFFWIARMIMASKHFAGKTAFKNVYFTSMIRDGKGRKLSKSLGNSPDPLNIIDKYGADAVRFTMIYLSPLGSDVRMDVDVESQDITSMELGRNFVNKVWNAGRFLSMKLEQFEGIQLDSEYIYNINKNKLTLADKWILSRFTQTINSINQSLDVFNVNEYAKVLYNFIWRDFCDWYIETVKVKLNNNQDGEFSIKLALSLYLQIMKLIHPVMPFVTEEIWYILLDSSDDNSISTTEFPKADNNLFFEDALTQFDYLQSIIEETRKLRAEANIPISNKVPIKLVSENENYYNILENSKDLVSIFAKTSELNIHKSITEKPTDSVGSVILNTNIYLILSGLIDKDKEREKINAEIARLEGHVASIQAKLNNPNFAGKAPEKVIEGERKKIADMTGNIEKLKENLVVLG